MKSSIWLMDPRPELPTMVRMVEHGFEMSEASSTPVMMELRIRACHVHGSFETKDNRPGVRSGLDKIDHAEFDYGRLAPPPSSFAQDVYVAILGYQMILDGAASRRQLVLEMGIRQDLNNQNTRVGSSLLRFQQAFGQHTLLQLDLLDGLVVRFARDESLLPQLPLPFEGLPSQIQADSRRMDSDFGP